jgi:hypothetical protein
MSINKHQDKYYIQRENKIKSYIEELMRGSAAQVNKNKVEHSEQNLNPVQGKYVKINQD